MVYEILTSLAPVDIDRRLEFESETRCAWWEETIKQAPLDDHGVRYHVVCWAKRRSILTAPTGHPSPAGQIKTCRRHGGPARPARHVCPASSARRVFPRRRSSTLCGDCEPT